MSGLPSIKLRADNRDSSCAAYKPMSRLSCAVTVNFYVKSFINIYSPLSPLDQGRLYVFPENFRALMEIQLTAHLHARIIALSMAFLKRNLGFKDMSCQIGWPLIPPNLRTKG